MAVSKDIRSVAGRQTTAGAAEETVLLSVDGSAPAASVAAPPDLEIIISGWLVTAEAPARFRLQQDRGSGFYDIAFLRVSVDGTVGLTDWGAIPIRIVGGSSFRVRVETPGGSTPVTVALRTYVDDR